MQRVREIFDRKTLISVILSGRMKAKLFIFITLAMLTGCPQQGEVSVSEDASQPQPTYDPVIVPDDFIACIIDVGQIKYIPDTIGHDSWQTPAETQEAGQGDCEDISIYFQHLLKQKGYSVEVVFGLRHRYAKTGHCWIEVQHDGELYICEPLGNAFLKRSKTHKLRYIRAEDIDIVKEKIRKYHSRTGIYVNSIYGQAIEAEKRKAKKQP